MCHVLHTVGAALGHVVYQTIIHCGTWTHTFTTAIPTTLN